MRRTLFSALLLLLSLPAPAGAALDLANPPGGTQAAPAGTDKLWLVRGSTVYWLTLGGLGGLYQPVSERGAAGGYLGLDGDLNASVAGSVTAGAGFLTPQAVTEGYLWLYQPSGTSAYRAALLPPIAALGDDVSIRLPAASGTLSLEGHAHDAYQPVDADLTEIAGLSPNEGEVLKWVGGKWTAGSVPAGSYAPVTQIDTGSVVLSSADFDGTAGAVTRFYRGGAPATYSLPAASAHYLMHFVNSSAETVTLSPVSSADVIRHNGVDFTAGYAAECGIGFYWIYGTGPNQWSVIGTAGVGCTEAAGATTGVAVDPASPFSYADTSVGSYTEQTFTATVTGTVTFSSVALTTGTVFTIQSNTCTGAKTNTTCQTVVRFTPAAGQYYTDTLTYTHDAPSSPDAISLSGTGTATGYAQRDSYGQTGTASTALAYYSTRLWNAMEWTAGSSYTLDRATLRLSRFNNNALGAGRTYRFQIREWDTVADEPKDAVLGYTDVAGDALDAALPSGAADYHVDFSPGVSVTAGTRYCVAVGLVAGSSSTTNHLLMWYQNTGTDVFEKDDDGLQPWAQTLDATATARIVTWSAQ